MTDWAQKRAMEMRLLIDGYVEGHAGQRFSVAHVAEETGSGVRVCAALLNQHPLVTKERGWHKYNQYSSIAPTLAVVQEEIQSKSTVNNAALGEEARKDWWYLIEERRRYIKRKYRVSKKF